MRRLMVLLGMVVGCARAPDFPLEGSAGGTLRSEGREVALNGSDLSKLGVMIRALPGRKAEVYSKPDYVITWEKDGAVHTMSFFTDERLVYPGDFTEAWTERMEGRASRGARLDAGLVTVLDGIVAP